MGAQVAQWVCAAFAFAAAALWLIASFIGVKGTAAPGPELIVGVFHKGREDIQYNGRLIGATSVRQAGWNAGAAACGAIAAIAQAVSVLLT